MNDYLGEHGKLVAILVATALALVFVLQNTDPVELRLLFWSFSVSRALMFFVLVGIGVVIGWFLRGRGTRRP